MSNTSLAKPQLPQSGSSSFLVRFLFEPVPIDMLVYFRFIFGGIIIWEVFRYIQRGWIYAMFVHPTFHFKYYGFEWVKPWSELGMNWHFLILGIAAFCVMIGFCYRIASLVVFLGFTFVFLLDQSYYLNHFYLVSVISFIMCLLPAHRAHSVDALLRPSIKNSMMPAWMLWLVRLQIGIPYFFGAIAKMESDWLSGVPVQMMIDPAANFPTLVGWFSESSVIFFFTFNGLLFDLLVVPALLWKRTRWLAVASVIVFNGMNHMMFQIGIFPWFMLLSTPIFFPPAFLQEGDQWAKELQEKGKEQFTKWTTSWKPRCIISLLALHFAIQVFLPFRHFLYPGYVNWTEQGHRFAWHMKLRIKRIPRPRFFAQSLTGEILYEFNLRDHLTNTEIREMLRRSRRIERFSESLIQKHASEHGGDRIAIYILNHDRFFARSSTGEVLQEFDLYDYLTYDQRRGMPKRPDMILQFAHHLADEYAREHDGERVAITTEIYCSLNNRQPQLLIDPTVDLAAIPRNLKHADWIQPLKIPHISLQPFEPQPVNNNKNNPHNELPPAPNLSEPY